MQREINFYTQQDWLYQQATEIKSFFHRKK